MSLCHIYYDKRWEGDHGIGRFARNVVTSDMRPLDLQGSPSSPADSLVLTLALLNVQKGTVFFSPGYNAPLFLRVPFVFTVCDLNHIDRPENSSIAKRIYYALVLKKACHRASYILTISEFSKRRIVEWSGVSPEKVVNVSVGIDSRYRPDVVPYDPGYRYLLCVSNRKEHKNDLRVIESFARVDIPEMHLLFTGNSTPGLKAYASKFGLDRTVHFLGRVPETELPSVYTGATALVFPSLYEGFGLPVIEAMACGTPVVTSNTTSLPEAAGDAALLVDPESVEEISAAITRLVNDSILVQDLRFKGLKQAARFSWKSTADKVHRVLEGVSGAQPIVHAMKSAEIRVEGEIT